MSAIGRLIDANVRCVRCDKSRTECRCWVPCTCGRKKERGTRGCHRCLSVEWTRTGPHEHGATIGTASLRTYLDGIHWRYAIRLPGWPSESNHDHRCGTNTYAQALAMAEVWRLADLESEEGDR